MRPEKMRYIINKQLEPWYTRSDTREFTGSKELELALEQYLDKEAETDATYSHRYDGWRSEMFYISDRWRCARRASWLLCGIRSKAFN